MLRHITICAVVAAFKEQVVEDACANMRLLVYAGAQEVPGQNGLRALSLSSAVAALRKL
jgi:hypothetical protein